MKNLNVTMLLAVGVCLLALFACSDDSSSSILTADENFSSSSVTAYSSSLGNEKSDISKKTESTDSSKVTDSSSSKKTETLSSSSKSAPKTSSSKTPLTSSSQIIPKSSDQKLEQSSSSASKKDWKEICLDIVNEYRATENLEPLSMASEEKQACVEKQSADDLASGAAHGHFGNCGEGAQNSGPNVRIVAGKTYDYYAQMCLKMMWEDEKALVTSGKASLDNDADYSKIGHYKNMKGNYKTLACGFAESSDGKTGWLNIDFFR